MWIDFIKEDPCKKFIEKKHWSQLQNWGTQENKLSAMVTPWKKMLSGNPLQPVSLLKIPKTFFIQEKSTKENFIHRKTTEVDFFQGKVKKIISSNKYSEKTLLKNWNIEKKEFLIFCKTLRT